MHFLVNISNEGFQLFAQSSDITEHTNVWDCENGPAFKHTVA